MKLLLDRKIVHLDITAGGRVVRQINVKLSASIDTIPYDTGLETPLCACSLLVVPEVLKRH